MIFQFFPWACPNSHWIAPHLIFVQITYTLMLSMLTLGADYFSFMQSQVCTTTVQFQMIVMYDRCDTVFTQLEPSGLQCRDG